MRCYKCGCECDGYLCGPCSEEITIEQLCRDLIEYRPAREMNALWDEMSEELEKPYDFKKVVLEIIPNLKSPQREYLEILFYAGENEYVRKENRLRLYELYGKVIDTCELTEYETNRLRGLVMNAYVSEYKYEDAEKIASLLVDSNNLPRWAYYTIADFYTKTRRYEDAEEVISEGLSVYSDNEYAQTKLINLREENNKRRANADTGKKEYMPAPKEAKAIYVDFLNSIGIDVKLPTPKSVAPKPIPREEYPEFIEITEPCFDSFVAYDFETTGFSGKRDSIIEIGAIKVVDGVLVESQEFVFQELVKPYRSKVTPIITEVTGITPEDVAGAREMWDVTSDFLDFVGDNVLVGYNNVAFDSKFLIRACRYCNRVINNPQFDLMSYVKKNLELVGLTDGDKYNLGCVAHQLGITNPQAHRALADAITTARVLLALK